MTIELVIIGDEILSGRTVDANLAWFAPWLTKRGLQLDYVTIVHDSKKDILTALETAWQRSDVVITSGGIGPTLDDVTKSVLAEFAQKKIVVNQSAQKIVENNYARINRPWTQETNSYHMIPEDFIATDNPTGLAPGLVWFENGKALMAAPGVPREFAIMVEQVFFPLLAQNDFSIAGDGAQIAIRTYGVPEEKIFGELTPMLWQELERFGKVSSLPHVTGVDIIISLTEKRNLEELCEQVKNLHALVPLKPHIWQWGTLSLEEYILQKARALGVKIACAESCTGGLVASRFTDIAGSSDVFLGSAVTYANAAKEKILSVKSSTLEKFGAVSEAVALEMAIGAKEIYNADFTVSFSGIAGPTGGSVEKPVGLVCQALVAKDLKLSRSLQFKGDRLKLKERFAMSGMFWLLEQLIRK